VLRLGNLIQPVCLAVAAFGAASLYGCGPPSTQSTNELLAEADRLLADVNEQFPSEDHSFKWEYESSVDAMTDKPTRTACIRSSNAVNLPPPYEPTRARLCLRDSPQHGHDAFVRLEKDGQILCHSYKECTVNVRFDKAAAQPFSAIGASDYSTDIFFIINRHRFEQELKTSNTTAIQAEFYQAGRQAMLFDTKGFAWPAK
jgi:hypothetical protein